MAPVTVRQLVFILCIMLPHSISQNNAVCKRSDTNFSECVRDEINNLRTTVTKGLPQLGIPSLDPMYIPKITLRQGNGPVSIDLTSTDQIFRGIRNYKIKSAHIDLKNNKMEFTVVLPWLFVEGKTNIEGKFLALPIQGSGESWSNYTMVNGKAVLTGHQTKRGDKDYFKLDDVKFDMSVNKATMHLNKLFNDNQELGDAMNKFMSENWEVLFNELKPVIDETVQVIIKDIAVKLFNRYSLNQLFPE